MYKFFLKFVVALLLLGGSTGISAQAQVPLSADTLSHHVIVLVDRSGSIRDNSDNSVKLNRFETLITRDLRNICFRDKGVVKDALQPDRALLDASKGDRLSIISFGLALQGPNFDNFIEISEGRNTFGMKYNNSFDENEFQDLWNTIEDRIKPVNFFRKNYSVISAAIPMGVHHLADSSELTNRTFVVLVSDNVFNGADPVDELETVKAAALYEYNRGRSRSREIKNTERVADEFFKVSGQYLWRKIAERSIENSRLDEDRNKVALSVYEVIPSAGVFAIESLLKFNTLEAHFSRIKGGYETRFELDPIMSSKLEVKKNCGCSYSRHYSCKFGCCC